MTQLALFSAAASGPDGLHYQPEFVSVTEESELVEHIRALSLVPFQFGAHEGHRRVMSFGWRYDYNERKLERADDIPAWLALCCARVEDFAPLPPGSIRQVLCTEYAEGVGIGWHRDKPHFDEVFGLSLASPCHFRFRRRVGAKWERFTLDAQPRSLYRMTGEARHQWEHSIPAVEAPRYSITFRTMAAG